MLAGDLSRAGIPPMMHRGDGSKIIEVDDP
jgi:hypothetical protein